MSFVTGHSCGYIARRCCGGVGKGVLTRRQQLAHRRRTSTALKRFPTRTPTEKEPHSHHLHSPVMCRVEALNNTCHIRSPGAMCLSIGHPEGASRRSETGAGVRSKHGEDRSHEETSIVRSGRHNPPRGPQTVPAGIAGPPPARSASLMPGGCIFKGLPPTFFLCRFGYPSAIARVRLSSRVSLGNAPLVLVPEYQTGSLGASQGTQASRQKSHLALTGPTRPCFYGPNASMEWCNGLKRETYVCPRQQVCQRV
jgi:hypothetical protein